MKLIERSESPFCVYKKFNIPDDFHIYVVQTLLYSVEELHISRMDKALGTFKFGGSSPIPCKDYFILDNTGTDQRLIATFDSGAKVFFTSDDMQSLVSTKAEKPYLFFLDKPVYNSKLQIPLAHFISKLKNFKMKPTDFINIFNFAELNLHLFSHKNIGKTFNKIQHYYHKLETNTRKASIKLLFDKSDETINKIKTSRLTNHIFAEVKTEAEFNFVVDGLEDSLLEVFPDFSADKYIKHLQAKVIRN